MQTKENLMRNIIQDPVTKELKAMPFDAQVDGLWHNSARECNAELEEKMIRDKKLTREEYMKTVTLLHPSEIKASETCSYCFFDLLDTTQLGRVLKLTVEAELIQTELLGASTSHSFSWINDKHNALEELTEVIHDALSWIENLSIKARMESLQAAHSEVGVKLSELYKSDHAKETFLAWATSHLGRSLVSSEMCLIGFRKVFSLSQNWDAGMLQSYSILNDDNKVLLHAPKYVVETLKAFQSFDPDPEYPAIDWVFAPADLSIVDTALRLWTSEGDGPLSTMSGALETAEAL